MQPNPTPVTREKNTKRELILWAKLAPRSPTQARADPVIQTGLAPNLVTSPATTGPLDR